IFNSTNNKISIARPYFCVYIASNSIFERDYMFRLLSDRKTHAMIHALGKCCNNLHNLKAFPEIHAHVTSFLSERNDYRKNFNILNHYRFALVMENINKEGYVTEKIINAFRAGAIPIYWGGNGYADKIFNPKAFIDIAKFSSFEECADYIVN